MPGTDRAGGERQSWQPLRLFNVYRLFVAALFLALWRFGLAPQSLGHLSPGLFFLTLISYLGLGLLAMAMMRLRWPAFHIQANLLAAGDVLAVILLAHSSGGVTSGVEVLLIPAIGAAGLLLSEISALFAAASASLLLLLDQIYLHLSGLQAETAYTQSGLLGLALFVTAVVSAALAHRARANEALAVRRGLDLANLAELNEHIVEHFNTGLIVAEPHGEIRLINDAAWQLMGHASGAHLDALPRLSPALNTLYQQWQAAPDGLHRTLALPGQGLELRIRFIPLGLDRQATLITLEDQAELAAQVQSAKLASLGRLAASIAHEIRNPLSAISHAAQLLHESPSLGAQDVRLVEIIRTQSTRMDAIVDDVLRLSRKDPPRTRPLDLKVWLQTQASEVRARLGEAGAEIRLHLDDTSLIAVCDEGHLAQIFWSLCENANRYGRRQADGRLSLTFAAHRPPGAQQIRLDVIDQGPGVPPEVVSHLFEPFFTTSTSGTGLGLYIASELCTLNSGHLEYIPVPGGGSCFRCFLPVLRRASTGA
ncbi:two-component system sensor histidine kinase NtrB [Acidihalobacter prosperus]|uniref:histidine kinase n=1 Tax=Acidihalobacter prosperus TaxID=160660 RepID=A0A1A6C3A2_9GAMM|nr:ATP-binding protein [Acidihalobacter prosperus]OBS09038.1 hypothetical protein Thpro_021366 [Acidihalobacter prosperus]